MLEEINLTGQTLLPALLLAFNRPYELQRCLETVIRMPLSRLHIVIDGPRVGNDEDRSKILMVTEVVHQTKFPFPVSTDIRAQNLGSGVGVARAISDFFQREKIGLIIEDDCVVDPSFPNFAQKILLEFEEDKSVISVSATNYCPAEIVTEMRADFYPSKYNVSGVWAAWAHAWADYDQKITARMFRRLARGIVTHPSLDWWMKAFWLFRLSTSKLGLENHAWDYQFAIYSLAGRKISLIPRDNMSSNIGFNSQGTNTLVHDKMLAELPRRAAPDVLTFPNNLSPDSKADNWFEENVLRAPKNFSNFFSRLLKFLSKRGWSYFSK